MGYNPRKRQEIAENTSFGDLSRVVYRGSQGIEILLYSKIMGYNPRKRPKMAENMRFADPSRVVYRGSQGIEILLDSKSWVITHANDQK